MKATGVVLAAVATLALTAVVANAVHKTIKIQSPRPMLKALPSPVAEPIKQLINPDNIRTHLRALTKKPHVAGTEANLQVAEYLRSQMISQGLENVHFNEYDVLLSYPNWTTPNIVEIVGEDGKTIYKTTGRSPSLVKEEQNDPFTEIQWFAYSANGVAEGDVVYVNKASAKDFAHLESLGIELKGKIFLARYSGTFRGNIAQAAVKKGAVGCLVYSDPFQVARYGTLPNQTFVNSDKMPPHAVQRGTVYVGLGDPRTPAFPSIANLHKEKTEEELLDEKMIPTIPILPIPYSDAQVLFEKLKGEVVIDDFKGNLTVTYRYGPGMINNLKVRMTVHSKNEERRIQNVLGYIKGSQEPDKFVLLSNHYDAWTYGAIDPNSGTATLLEVSRAMKAYQNSTGWTPARSILFAHWDAEEYGLLGSTEFAEEFRVQLMRKAVAVLNMDLVGGNQTLFGMCNPTLSNVLRGAAVNVKHPNEDEQKAGRKTLYDSWKHFQPSETNRSSHPYQRNPAGGSDHLPFFDYLGIPVIMFITSSLDAPPTYPLYHTIYETPFLIEKILDPQYKMHKAIGEMFVEMTLQFTESKILPYDLRELLDETYFEYLPKIETRLDEMVADENITQYVKPGYEQFQFLKDTVLKLSVVLHERNVTKLEALPFAARVNENNRLMEFEKCFLNPQGAPGSPQARHLLFHPSAEDWYNGGAIAQVHDALNKFSTTTDKKQLKLYSKRLAREISMVHFAFICAKHSLDDFFLQ